MSGLKKLVKEPVEFILEPGTDKTPEPSLMQITLLCAQHLSTGEVDLLNLSLSVKAAKANGGKFVQLGILALRLFRAYLTSAQLFVLHLQFDTVHIQFVDHLGSTLIEYARSAPVRLLQQILRPLTQVVFFLIFVGYHVAPPFSRRVRRPLLALQPSCGVLDCEQNSARIEILPVNFTGVQEHLLVSNARKIMLNGEILKRSVSG